MRMRARSITCGTCHPGLAYSDYIRMASRSMQILTIKCCDILDPLDLYKF